MQHVFVYGTLKRGEGNHGLLEQSEYKGRYFVKDIALIDSPGFPYAFDAEGEIAVGELYKVDKQTMAHLDELEGYPTHYNRKKVRLYVDREGTKKSVKAWIYYIDYEIEEKVARYGTVQEWASFRYPYNLGPAFDEDYLEEKLKEIEEKYRVRSSV